MKVKRSIFWPWMALKKASMGPLPWPEMGMVRLPSQQRVPEKETAEEIREVYGKTGYVLDTHTAVASKVYKKYVAQTDDRTIAMIASTASPYKFTRSVMNAIDEKFDSMSDFELVDKLEEISKVSVPKAIEEIRTAPVLHDTVVEVEEMKDTVKKFLGLK